MTRRGVMRYSERDMWRVLVVEDDSAIREMFMRFFRMRGHDAHEAADGQAAVTMAGHQQFDVILMDVKMPKLDGLSATQQIRAAAPSTKVVLVTGYSRSPELEGLLEPGMVECLHKPCTYPELSTVLNRLFAKDAGSDIAPSEPPKKS